MFTIHLTVNEVEEVNQVSARRSMVQPKIKKKRWTLIITYTLLVLLGQSTATLLSRLYYTHGGHTVLLEALLEILGFPILFPFALYYSPKYPSRPQSKLPSISITTPVYTVLGLLQVGSTILYAIGLKNLPVSTFSLISTTQLGFNALFSFLINSQKITFLILNSIFLLTVSSSLLMFNNSEQNSKNQERKQQVLGFSCTLVASALYSLVLSLTELAFNKALIKTETFASVLNIIIYQSMVETSVVIMAMVFTEEWRNLAKEMESFELGKMLYWLILAAIAVSWQLFAIGAVSLIFEVSSLFSNVIGSVGLPLMPILAVIFFHEKMDGLKIVSLLLAALGFASYVYQNYLDGDKHDEIVGVTRRENYISQELVVMV